MVDDSGRRGDEEECEGWRLKEGQGCKLKVSRSGTAVTEVGDLMISIVGLR
jgi:hypothetical protein